MGVERMTFSQFIYSLLFVMYASFIFALPLIAICIIGKAVIEVIRYVSKNLPCQSGREQENKRG